MAFFSNILIPVVVSFAIHAVVFLALAMNWQSAPKPIPAATPKFIEAKLVKLETQAKKKATAPKKPKKIDLAAKRKEQERLKREQEKKQQKIKREKEKAAAKAREEKKRREEEAQRKKAEKERKAREKQQRLQREFEQALQEEQGLLMEEEFANEAQSYASKFKQRVEANWSRPPSARTGMRCLLSIQLVPTGRIVSVDIVESSGSVAFDRSAVQAVKKVEVFPEAKEMPSEVFERYYRNFKFLFNPQDLRL